MKISQVILLLLISLVVSVAGLGLSYPSEPLRNFELFRSVSSDGWIQDGSVLTLNNLASRGNRLILELSSANRPPAAGPANIRVSGCGRVLSEFFAERPLSTQKIILKADCSPNRLVFEVMNPWIPSEKDPRRLGAQLTSARVTSGLGLPLVEARLVLSVAAAVFALALILLPLGSGPALPLISQLASFVFIARTVRFDLENEFALWTLLFAACLGLLCASRLNSARRGQSQRKHFAGSKAATAAALFALILGGGLRFYGLDFGFPHLYHPDEVPKVNAIMRMVANGSFDPEYFLHPSFLLYSAYFLNKLFHFFGMEGDFRETAFLAGRTVSATLGTLTILLTYLTGRRLYGAWAGAVSAFALALFPLHVTCSRYMKEDASLLFWIMATLVVVLKAVQEDKRRLLFCGAFLAGVAASTKYSGLLAAGIIAAAPWLRSRDFRPDPRFFRAALASSLCFPAGFILVTPFSVLNTAGFLRGFSSEQNHMLRGHTVTIDAWSQLWMFHFSRSVIPGMTFFSTFISCAALGFLLWRRKMEDLLIVGSVLLFYLPAEWVKAKPAPQPERYIFPILPFMAIAAAEFFRVLRQAKSSALVPLVAALFIAVPAWRSLELASEIKNDTRERMSRWMISNLPAGSKVVIDYRPYGPNWFKGEFEPVFVSPAELFKMEAQDFLTMGADYMVFSSLTYDRHFSLPSNENVALRAWLRNIFQSLPIIHEERPIQGTYGFQNPWLTLFSLKHEEFERLQNERRLKSQGELEETSNEKIAVFRWDEERRR